jgi:Flp pilus assembly protein TadD
MLAVPAAAILMRSRPVALTAMGPSARTVGPLPAAGTPSPTALDERFLALVGRALRAAQERTLPEAAGLLEKALELKPTDAEAWNSLGVVLVLQGETVRGADAFGQALRLDPAHHEAHRNLAVVLDRQGRSGEAVSHYRAFLRLSPASHPTRDEVRRRLAEVSGSRAEE